MEIARLNQTVHDLRGENDRLRERLLQQDGWNARPRAEEQTELFSVTEMVTFTHAAWLLWMLGYVMYLLLVCCVSAGFQFLGKQGDNTDDVCAVTVKPEQSVIVGR